MSSLNSYAQDLDKALKSKTQFSNFNKDTQHATVVVCIAFAHAKEKIRLLSNKLDTKLYGGQWFNEEMKDFLARDGCLDVLIESTLDSTHPVVQMAKKHPDSIVIKRVPDEEKKKYQYNFMVVDDIGYRFEHNRDKHEALVVFHDPNPKRLGFMKTLTERFDGLAELSQST